MVVIKKDIIYDENNNLKTDIYFPNNTNSQTKILIFWHGGGWFAGSKNDVKNWGDKVSKRRLYDSNPRLSSCTNIHFSSCS